MGPSTESEKILGPEAVEMLWKTAFESLRAERLALAARLGLVRPVTDSATSFVFSGCSSLVPTRLPLFPTPTAGGSPMQLH